MSVDFVEALHDLFATLDAEDWDGLVDLLEDDADLADELTGSWLHGRDAVAAYLRAQAGIVTEISSPVQNVQVRHLGSAHALVTFEMRQRYRLDGDIRRESLTGCVVFNLHPEGARVALYHLGGAGSVSRVAFHRPPPAARISPPLGDELRRRRTRAGLSLRALAHRTGLSASFLSQIERGGADPSVSSLARIADGLGISTADLLPGPTNDEVRTSRTWERHRVSLRGAGVEVEGLTGLSGGSLEAWIADLSPSAQLGHASRPPGGEELVLLLEGAADVSVGARVYELRTGDATFLRGSQPHVIQPREGQSARVLVVQATQTEPVIGDAPARNTHVGADGVSPP
jgi:transcriptional regulator with XRE-family HTH domain